VAVTADQDGASRQKAREVFSKLAKYLPTLSNNMKKVEKDYYC